MHDPGWDEWDLERVHAALWPGAEDWPDVELWPEARITPPSHRAPLTAPPRRASDVEALGDAHITYWVWAVSTPFVKIGQTQYVPAQVIESSGAGRRRVVLRGALQQAENRVAKWATGSPWPLRFLRVHVEDKGHERIEHKRYAVARMPAREWFDLRRLETPARGHDSS